MPRLKAHKAQERRPPRAERRAHGRGQLLIGYLPRADKTARLVRRAHKELHA